MNEKSNDQESIGKILDPALKIDLSESKHWGETLLEKLIRERRKMPKEERLQKFRNDSVDEVDTTDLENWVLRNRASYEKVIDDDEDSLEFQMFID
jgi:hypothetical protein